MANPEHEAILRQGVEVWNKWRKENPDIEPDLSEADFRKIVSNKYTGVLKTFRGQYGEIDLRNANLREVNFNLVDMSMANLSGANLTDANLSGANLTSTNFTGANLTRVNLDDTNLSSADLSEAILNESYCSYTIFADLDLSNTKGLDTVEHDLPSTLGVDTLFKSRGKIPEIFLRGCGVPETLITFLPSMLEEAIQLYSCFISYSHKDKEFAKRLYDRLQGAGIRCWFDEHQLNPGDELHPTIYDAIRIYDKVILCCSETALTSWWVEKEFKNVINKEEDFAEKLLIPLTLDNYVFEQSSDKWIIGEIKRRVIQKFDNWKDHDAFEQSFEKIVKALRTDGGKPPPPASKLTPRKP